MYLVYSIRNCVVVKLFGRKSETTKMSTECLISFDENPEKVFYAGQTASGRVELSFTESKTVRGKQNFFGIELVLFLITNN